jgi:alkanesulfonate monooxygenase SsuD/methylene tetrahydromethanopterin reductase-like flavin-dependent oxidoreductase (luciferase family)
VNTINHSGQFFKVRGPLNVVPSPQGRPVLIQAGSSSRGIKASAHFADHVFASSQALNLRQRHRRELDAALVAVGRDPERVGILWGISLIVAETEQEALSRKENILRMMPRGEAVGAYLAHNAGYDFSTLPARFTLKELNDQITAINASPVGFVHQLANEIGADTEITRDEFFEHGLKSTTAYDRTIAGTSAQVADYMEEAFEATGSRGGFMFAHPVATPRDILSVVDFLVPELRRRGRFRNAYEGHTLMENLAI